MQRRSQSKKSNYAMYIINAANGEKIGAFF